MLMEEALRRSEILENEFEELILRIVKDWYNENKLDKNKRDLFLDYVDYNFLYEGETNTNLIEEVYENLLIHQDLLKSLFEYKSTTPVYLEDTIIEEEIKRDSEGDSDLDKTISFVYPTKDETIHLISHLYDLFGEYPEVLAKSIANFLTGSNLTKEFGAIGVKIESNESELSVRFDNDKFTKFLDG